MNKLFYTTLALASIASTYASTSVISLDIIQEINTCPNSTWVAGINENWYSYSSLEVAQNSVLGYVPSATKLPVKQNVGVAYTSVPAEFDAREQWGNMCGSVKHVYNQASCGSCWAVSTASAATDRLCIASNGTVQTILSSGELISDCSACGQGCQGGDPSQAWSYFINTGLVTGGDYGVTACYSYPFAPCAQGQHCTDNTPQYTTTCKDTEVWSQCKTYGTGQAYTLGSIADIQNDIMQYGSVVATFNVYSDFMNYKSGVYKHKTGQYMGGHAVRMIGWGTDSTTGTDYWLIQNSWGNSWGLNGAFWIARGNNECGIEENVSAGYVNTHQ